MSISDYRGWRGRKERLTGMRERGVWCGIRAKNRFMVDGKSKVAKRREYIDFESMKWCKGFYYTRILRLYG